MEYNDLMKQAEDFNKKLHRTKDINVADCFTREDKATISDIIDKPIAEEYGDMYPFRWQLSCTGHFIC